MKKTMSKSYPMVTPFPQRLLLCLLSDHSSNLIVYPALGIEFWVIRNLKNVTLKLPSAITDTVSKVSFLLRDDRNRHWRPECARLFLQDLPGTCCFYVF